MKTKYIISLSMLVALTSPSCQGAALSSNWRWQLCKTFAGQCANLIQHLTSTLKDGNPREISRLISDTPALTDMPAEIIDQIAQQLNSSSLMLFAETNPTFYKVIKNMPSFQNLKQLIERHNGDLVAAFNDAVENDNTWPISYLMRRLNDNPATANIVHDTLIKAIDKNQTNKVADLLQGGANPNSIDKTYKYMPLLRATTTPERDDKIVELLLKYGANVDSEDFGGYTPLAWAIMNKNMTIVDLLLAASANVEKTISKFEQVGQSREMNLLKEHYAQYQKQHPTVTATEITK